MYDYPNPPPKLPRDGIVIPRNAIIAAVSVIALGAVGAGAFLLGNLAGSPHHHTSANVASGPPASTARNTAPSSPSTSAPPATTTTTSSSTTTTTTPPPPAPTTVIRTFYRDLETQDYPAAWAMQSPQYQSTLGSFASWEAGYATTASAALAVDGAYGNQVDISLDATQTDGSQRQYQGVYYVHNGLITGADVALVADIPGPWCAASVDPSYNGWGDIILNVTSNQPNSPITITTNEAGATSTLTATTDAYGDATSTYPSASNWQQGYTVQVHITVGAATCATVFAP